MKKILAIFIILAILCGAAFGLQWFEKHRISGGWLAYVDCKASFAEAYIKVLQEYADVLKLQDIDFTELGKSLETYLPELPVPVTLEFNADGSFRGTISDEAIREAADAAIVACNTAVSHLLADFITQPAEGGLLSGLFNSLFGRIDVSEFSDPAVIGLLETTVTNGIDRLRFGAGLHTTLEAEGSYKVLLGKLYYIRVNTARHSVRYKLERGSLILSESDSDLGYLAPFVGSELKPVSNAVV